MCGLFGRISLAPKKIDKLKLNVLGVTNDTRGGDSTGIFIDREVEYGVLKEKLYSDFMQSSMLLHTSTKAKVILGHTRKASVGVISEETAHPITIKNDKDEIEFVMIHNGTIFNYLELAKKHIPNLNIKGLTDSQVMANIFYYCGFDVLQEYEGAGAFVIADYRESKKDPTIYIFKGASKKYKYSTKDEEERPLYAVLEGDEIWFSSMYLMLDTVSWPLESLVINPNLLLKVVNDEGELKLDIVREIDRSNSFQYKDYVQNQREYYSDYSGHNWSGNYSGGVKTVKEIESGKGKNDNDANAIKSLFSGRQTKWIDTKETLVSDRVTLLKDGLFYVNNKPLTGWSYLDEYGNSRKPAGNEEPTHYFFEGRLIPSKDIYHMLLRVKKELSSSFQQFSLDYPEVLDFFSYMPTVNLIKGDAEFYVQKNLYEYEAYSGLLVPLFTEHKIYYFIKDGEINQATIGGSVIRKERKTAYDEYVSAWAKGGFMYNQMPSVGEMEMQILDYALDLKDK